ncbi:MAG: AMP-binding protein, partial [Ardenticatenales bacterium]|nr:AMP-binding protein [Ardenticatenales bacterium]
YGPTEGTIVVTRAELTQEVTDSGLPLPIGRPIANTQLYVLDHYGRPCPIGVPGELHIGGAGVARGYHSHPALTATRFVPNPFSPTPGARLYRTGDLVRYRPDGQLLFLGRTDDQIKIRGFRIEPGEIAACLRQHPAVQEAYVLPWEAQAGDLRLVAYVVAEGETEAMGRTLREHVQGQLPAYMVPAYFVSLERLPKSPSGKIDRRALPTPDPMARPDLTHRYVAPSTLAEETLATMFSQVTGVEKIGVHDNFFELGGHSLLATQLVARARSAFEVDISLRSFFDAPTIAELALVIEEALIAKLEAMDEEELEALL